MLVTAKVAKCKCQHEGQDKLHGKKNRVHNWAAKAEGWRCTVCGDLKGK